jgi:tetracycline repressor-like protein
VREAGGPPDVQLRAFVSAIANNAIGRPHFPAVWLREMADGGRHLDHAIVADLRRVVQTLAAILEDGRATGRFQGIHPILAQVTIVAPLLMFEATAPIRERFQDQIPGPAADLSRDAVIAHIQRATLAALSLPPSRTTR